LYKSYVYYSEGCYQPIDSQNTKKQFLYDDG